MTIRQLARDQIAQLVQKYNVIPEKERPSLTEANVLHQFITPLLVALGWPIADPVRSKFELSTQTGRPDVVLFPEAGGPVYVEAKRFGIIAPLAQAKNRLEGIITPGQLSLPGMAADRTAEEQQAINYAFSNNGAWAILTNFERLRLFNARRDWLVLSFERPSAYLDEFDQLWQLSYESIVDGRLDQLSSQRHREDVDSNYLNFINEWRERLAQDILSKQAENWWVLGDDGRVQLPHLRAVVQQILDRLVVVRFAEDHLIIPAGTLFNLAEVRRTNPYTFSLTQFLQQLFRRFDEDHNSALFAPALADQAVFSDGVLDGLIGKLYEARYRAMTADIMGNTYEQYLGKTLVLRDGAVRTSDNLETRKKQGSYYTPQVIVRYLVDNSLERYLAAKTAGDIQNLRVIDPACGSGSFLIYAYELLADFYRCEIARLEAARQARYEELVAQGITTPFELQLQLTAFTTELERLHHYPRIILENHLYGVDLDPQAAEIATVNLMMRAMADQRRTDKRLPLILNQNIKVGNALVGAGPHDPRLAAHAQTLAELCRLRQEAVQGGHGPAVQQQIAALSQQVNDLLNGDLTGFENLSGLEAIRPFNWPVEFPEVFVAGAGFDIVIGNPPWEIVKPDLREYYAQFDERIESKFTREQTEARIAELNAFDPALEEGWREQIARIETAAAYYKKSGDFTRQGKGDTATHKLFLERGYNLLRPDGRLAFVIPSGIYTDLGTKELREMLLNDGRIEYLYNFSNERYFFPSVHHAFKFTLLGTQKGQNSDGFWAAFRINPRVSISPDDLLSFLADSNNLIFVRQDSLKRFDPDSLTLMEFETNRQYEVAENLYSRWPLLGEELDGSWNLEFTREFDMSNDSHLFNQQKNGFPLYEGKMIHQFNPYFAQPRFWIDENLGKQKLAGNKAENWHQSYRFAFREVSGAVNERTCIATVLPPNTFAGHTLWVGVAPDPATLLYYVAMANSLCIDWITRFKVNFHVTLFIMKSLPVPRLTAVDPIFNAIVPRAAQLTCTTAVFAPLWESVMGTPFPAPGATHFGSATHLTPATDPATRQRLRHELDALVAHLYGLSRADFAHILDTFPLVFPPTPEGAAKKDTLLTTYDEFAGRE